MAPSVDIRVVLTRYNVECLLTLPIFKSSFLSSLAYLRSNNRSFAKSKTDVPTCPALRSVALYPNVKILARQSSGSSARKVRGQKSSGSLFLDHVYRLVPPSPCMKMMSALCPSSGVYTTLSPRAPASDTLSLRERFRSSAN